MENTLDKYKSKSWNGRQITAISIGAAVVLGIFALSILINPYILLAAPAVVLITILITRKISNINYRAVNIEEKTLRLAEQEIHYMTDVKLPNVRLPDFEFVRYILAGGDFNELLAEADRLVNKHLADDEYIGNLLRNLQIATLARKEACCRRHVQDPAYTAEQKKLDMEAATDAFIKFKEELLLRAL